MTAVASLEAPARIPVWRSVGQTYTTVFANLVPLLKIAAFPLLLCTVIPVATMPVYPLVKAQIGRLGIYETVFVLDRAGLESLIDVVLLAIPVMLFCSHWLQFLAAREAMASWPRGLLWTRRDIAVLRYFPLCVIASLLLFLYRLGNVLLDMLYPISSPITDLAMKFGLWIFDLEFWGSLIVIVMVNATANARFGPAVAAAALDGRIGLRGAWRMTRGQGLRLVFLWLVLYNVTGAAAYLGQNAINRAYEDALNAGFDPSFGLIPSDNEMAWQAVWQIVQLPQSLLTLVALALNMTVFARVYRAAMTGSIDTPQDILERFE